MFSWWSFEDAKDTSSAIPKRINKEEDIRAAHRCTDTAATDLWRGRSGPKSGDLPTNLWTQSGMAGRAEAFRCFTTEPEHHFLLSVLFLSLRNMFCTDLSKKSQIFCENNVTLMLDCFSYKSSLPNHWKQNELMRISAKHKADNSMIILFVPLILLKLTTNISIYYLLNYCLKNPSKSWYKLCKD